jgi:hypothetical protein
VHSLEHRRVLVDWQPIEVGEPGQRLIDAAVTAFRRPRRGMLRRGMLRRGMLRPGGTVAVALHQALLLSSSYVLRVHQFSEERYRPEPTGRVTRRAGAMTGSATARRASCRMDTVWEARWTMATAEECRKALETLTSRLSEMGPEDRAAHLVDRVISCRVDDLGLTFLIRLGPDGAGPVTEATGGEPPAQVRFTAKSDDLLKIADDPGSFARAWLTGRLKIEASVFDLLRLRKLL